MESGLLRIDGISATEANYVTFVKAADLSFTPTSILMAKLSTFIQSEFNHQIKELELATTASCISLATAIVRGDEDGDEIPTEMNQISNGKVSQAVESQACQMPSAYADTFEDLFPKSPDNESGLVSVDQA